MKKTIIFILGIPFLPLFYTIFSILFMSCENPKEFWLSYYEHYKSEEPFGIFG